MNERLIDFQQKYNLASETIEKIRLWREFRWNKLKENFPFQNLPDTERLSYELMTWDNFRTYLSLFEGDEDEFVDERFKSIGKLEEYAVGVLEFAHFSVKHGGCDWFIRLKDHSPVGVLHLYELNLEIIEGKHLPCFFGYALSRSFRGQGFAYEAAKNLLEHIPKIFERYEVYAEPKTGNQASRNLLKRLGFSEIRTLSGNKSSLWYKKLIEGEIPGAKIEYS